MTLEVVPSDDDSTQSNFKVHHDTHRSSTSPFQKSSLSGSYTKGQNVCLQNHERDSPARFTRKRKLQGSTLASLQSAPAKKVSSQLNRGIQRRESEEVFDQTIGGIRRQNTKLEDENLQLKQKLYQSQRPTVQFLHRVYCSDRDESAITTDPPSQLGSSSHLQGQEVIPKLDIFIAERRINLIFAVFKNYLCCMDEGDKEDEENEENEEEAFRTKNDSVLIVSPKFSQHLIELTDSLKKPKHFFPQFKAGNEFSAPFCWYYWCITEFETQSKKLTGQAREYIDVFQYYVKQDFHQLYESVAAQMRGKTILWETLPFLYSPGTIVVWQEGAVENVRG
ncbi:hypothetical protein MMC10_007339 [Thelotrema lepadinum]|nr:hypothetical protein [Thelotrema lepadinum]